MTNTIDWNAVKETAWMTKEFNLVWYKLNNRNNVGDMSYIYHKLQPTDYQDFYTKYTQDAYTDETIQHKGRTEVYIIDIARKYQAYSGRYDITLYTFFLNVLWHIIVQTFDGHKKENELINWLKGKGIDARPADSTLDAEYGVDIVIYNENQPKQFLQCKPISFFKGNLNESLKNDRKISLKKYQKSYNIYGIRTYYTAYSRDGRWLKQNNKYCFKLETMINSDGTTRFIEDSSTSYDVLN